MNVGRKMNFPSSDNVFFLLFFKSNNEEVGNLFTKNDKRVFFLKISQQNFLGRKVKQKYLYIKICC